MPMTRRKFLGMIGATVGLAVMFPSSLVYLANEADNLVVERLQIPLVNLPAALEGFTIVQLSDFHLYPFTSLDFIGRAVELANSLNPDLVVLGGDYVTRSAEAIFELTPLFASLNAKYGVFSIMGNHDIWTDVRAVTRGLTEAGLPILVNQGVALNVGGAPLYLAGLDDAWSGQPDLTAAMTNCPNGAPVILLAHEPDPADQYCQDLRLSLQLSGHSHGGQVRLPGRGAAILPHMGRKYDMGMYRVNQTWLYTSRGLGNVTEPLRLNCTPEVSHFTLVRA